MSERVVVDASALLSLASADFLWYPLENFELVVPESVLEELGGLKEKAEMKAIVEKILREKSKFTIIRPKQRATGPHLGERECLQVCTEQGIEIFVLDDFRAIRRLKPASISKGVNLLLSVFFVSHAAASGKISKEEALVIFDRMAKRRDWIGGRVYLAGKSFLERELRKSK